MARFLRRVISFLLYNSCSLFSVGGLAIYHYLKLNREFPACDEPPKSIESACNIAAQGYNCTTLTAPIREAHPKLCLFLLLACSCAGFVQNLRHFSTGEE